MRAVLRAATQRSALSGATVSSAQGAAQAERHRREQHLITVMLIVVVGVFLVCMLPQAVQNLLVAYLTASGHLTATAGYRLRISGNVFNLLVMLNSSVNFFLYSHLSAKFRRTFKIMFCRCHWTDAAIRQAARTRDGGCSTALTAYYNTAAGTEGGGERKASAHSLVAVGGSSGVINKLGGPIGDRDANCMPLGYARMRSCSAISCGPPPPPADRQLAMSKRRNYFPMQNFAQPPAYDAVVAV